MIDAGSGDKLADAQREIEVLQALRHPNIIPLLDSAVSPIGSSSSSSSEGGMGYRVHMLFPAYQDGTLQDELQRLEAAGQQLSTYHLLDILAQVCMALQHMHARGWAHRDLKPHNILLSRPGSGAAGAGGSTSALAEADPESGTARYEAVVMDFGSARRVPQQVSTRMDALALQEDAEAHCTGTYRAPELFDVATHSSVSERVDVWSLGCTAFAMMYGSSPFQAALDQGASLALAVLNCRIPWPKGAARRYSDEVHSLVNMCLVTDPAARPGVAQVTQRVRELQQRSPPDPTPPAKT